MCPAARNLTWSVVFILICCIYFCQSFRHLFIATIHDEVKVIEKEEKFELYLCERPIRKVFLLGTVVDMRLKSTRDDTTKG